LTVIRSTADLPYGIWCGPGDTRFSAAAYLAADVASVQFSRTVERRVTPAGLSARGSPVAVTPRGSAGAGLSKLNSMLDSFDPATSSPQAVEERVVTAPSSQVRSTC